MKTLVELLDERYELEEQKRLLEARINDLSNEIVVRMIEGKIKKAKASNGLEYTTGSSTKYIYQKPAYDYIEEKGLLEHFKVPKITQSKLDELLKNDLLSYEDRAIIEKHTIVEQSAYYLKKLALKEKQQ